MKKGFLIYEQVREYLVIYDFTPDHFQVFLFYSVLYKRKYIFSY
jgi:hypothetical protein